NTSSPPPPSLCERPSIRSGTVPRSCAKNDATAPRAVVAPSKSIGDDRQAAQGRARHRRVAIAGKGARYVRTTGSLDRARPRGLFLRRQEAPGAVALSRPGHERVQEGCGIRSAGGARTAERGQSPGRAHERQLISTWDASRGDPCSRG